MSPTILKCYILLKGSDANYLHIGTEHKILRNCRESILSNKEECSNHSCLTQKVVRALRLDQMHICLKYDMSLQYKVNLSYTNSSINFDSHSLISKSSGMTQKRKRETDGSRRVGLYSIIDKQENRKLLNDISQHSQSLSLLEYPNGDTANQLQVPGPRLK